MRNFINKLFGNKRTLVLLGVAGHGESRSVNFKNPKQEKINFKSWGAE
jgi:hypothetical protein